MEKTLTKAELDDLAEAVDGEVHTSYGGRGMFNERCVGISCSDLFLLGVSAGLILGEEKAVKLARATRTDALGMGNIVYWPGWTLSDKDKEESKEVCDECGAVIPDLPYDHAEDGRERQSETGGLANKHHKDSCSLYDENEE